MKFSDCHTLLINGTRLQGDEILQFCRISDQENIRQLGSFMNDWLNDNPLIEVKTSGSTGTPKTIWVEKKQMLESASLTAGFFGFEKGQNALLSLPIRYIAGKMMVVRALYSGLNLICVEPGGNPVSQIPAGIQIDFAPLVPAQLDQVTETNNIRKILLGGAPVSPVLENKLQHFKTEIYHSYGMAETLSHVALRRVNGQERTEVYSGLQGVTFDIDERECLIIDVPFLDELVYTNDIVNLIDDHRFIWKGRFDHVINSGGIKFFPEEIERKLFGVVPQRFFIAGMPDERFGEKICMFIESDVYSDNDFDTLVHIVSEKLDRYEKPRDYFFVKEFETTASGKVMRNRIRERILSS